MNSAKQISLLLVLACAISEGLAQNRNDELNSADPIGQDGYQNNKQQQDRRNPFMAPQFDRLPPSPPAEFGFRPPPIPLGPNHRHHHHYHNERDQFGMGGFSVPPMPGLYFYSTDRQFYPILPPALNPITHLRGMMQQDANFQALPSTPMAMFETRPNNDGSTSEHNEDQNSSSQLSEQNRQDTDNQRGLGDANNSSSVSNLSQLPGVKPASDMLRSAYNRLKDASSQLMRSRSGRDSVNNNAIMST